MVGITGSTTGTTQYPLLMPDTPYVVILEIPAQGAVHVTCNGITLFESDVALGVEGDYSQSGPVFTFPPNQLRDGDILQFFYTTSNSTGKSYYMNRIIAPATIPVVTSGYPDLNTIYTNGLNYYVQLDPVPQGAIGFAYNGVVLTEDGDFTRYGVNKIELNNLTYPTGVVKDDLLTFFLFYRYYFNWKGD